MVEKHDISKCGKFHCWCCNEHMPLRDAPICENCVHCKVNGGCKNGKTV